jgi:putative spermidine/putrescine transport system substrate-binding protein
MISNGCRREQIPLVFILFTAVLIFSWVFATATVAETWQEILKRARGQTVDWHMWGGSPSTNTYVNGYVAPRVKELYGVKLRQVPVTDTSEVVSKILVEKQAGKNTGGKADLLWINGNATGFCTVRLPISCRVKNS